jgi:hypothetical protein
MKTNIDPSQKDPAEGSREVIDRELKRKGLEGGSGAAEGTQPAHDKNKAAMDEAAPQTGTRGGP